MLELSDRRLLLDALRPPEGYAFDELVATTYSIDLIALLTTPLAFTFFDWETDDGRPTEDPLALLEAVRRYADRITVFCQAGEIAVPPHDRALYVHVEDCVVPVIAPRGGGVFHPKLWVARYRSRNGESAHHRVLCLSRNLTGDRSWDTILVLEGTPTARGGRAHESEPLAAFLEVLPEMAVGHLTDARHSATLRLADEIRRVRFQPPQGFEDVRFWPLGVEGRRPWPLGGRISRALVISPFVTSSCLQRIKGERGPDVLVARPDELQRMPPTVWEQFDRVCAIDEAAQVAADGGDGDGEPPSSASSIPQGLHAKAFVVDDGRNARVYTGSANATTAAFERNVEFMVELSGKRSAIGVDATLQPGKEGGLESLLIDLDPPDEALPEDPVRELEQQLDGLVHSLAARPFTARVYHQGDAYRIDLEADVAVSLPTQTQLRCWPITQRREHYLEPRDAGAQPMASFPSISLEAITSFFACELELVADDLSVSRTFVLRSQLVDAPEGRREAVLRALLSDPRRVLAYLRLLLAEGGADGLLPLPMGGGPLVADGAAAGWPIGDAPLLEALVRALESDPLKLDMVARLVNDLSGPEENANLLPHDFERIWSPIWAAREAARA